MHHPILLRRLLPGLFLLAACRPGFAGEILRETFDSAPAVAGGKLELRTDNPDAGAYANTGYRSTRGVPEFDFTRQDVRIVAEDLGLDGTAAPARQIFVLILASNAPGESSAAGFIKLRISGNGNVSLSIPKRTEAQPAGEAMLASGKVALPIRKVVLTLDAKGYKLEVTGQDGAPFAKDGAWEAPMDLAVWQDSNPTLILRAVRAPGDGEVVATLDALAAENP
jgi:hypothetical protein